MSRVDVLLSAHGAADWFRRSLDTVLAERAFELRVFTRGDAEATSGAPRVEVLTSDGNDLADALGVWAAQSTAPFVLVVATEAVLLPDAMRRMLEPMVADPAVAQVLGVAVPTRRDGTADRDRMRHRTKRHLDRLERIEGVPYLAAFGDVDIGAALFRRSALVEAEGAGGGRHAERAPADASAREGWLFPTVITTAAHGRTIVLRDPVAAMPEATTSRVPGVAARLMVVLRRLRAYPPDDARGVGRRGGLWRAAIVAALDLENVGGRWREVRASAWRQFAWRTIVPLRERLYDVVLARLSGWPLGVLSAPSMPAGGPRSLAYYAWRFPILSETFIRRELRALAGAGVGVIVVADAAGEGSADDPELAIGAERVRYLHPITRGQVLRDALGWLVRRPLRTSNLLAYTICRPFREPKSLPDDARVFLKAVHLAAVLRKAGVDHVHSPWGDTNAFIAMVAARLAGIGFSLQFRAHDLHRRTAAFLIAEKVRNARFVVTNTDYNLARLHALARPADRAKIRRIYNGLELGRMPPPARPAPRRDGEIRVLSVARLIEPKGIPYLFAACRALRDRGYPLRCRIIGGPELPKYVNDLIEIRMAHQRLALDGWIELVGARPFAEVAAAYHEADIFVLPCVVGRDGSNDITPNSLLEAMAAGLPVVSTTITAIPELVEDEVSGLLVPPNDAAALARAIERLIEDPDLRARLGSAAQQRIHERFDVERNIGAYVELFTAS